MLKKFKVDKGKKSNSKKEKSLRIKNVKKNKIKKDKIKKGRKMKNNENTQEINEKNNSNEIDKNVHGKYSPDNIIQKAKNKAIKYLFIYSPIYLNKYKLNIKKEIVLKKIEYKGFNNDLNKDINLQLLDTPLSTILSYTNSSKCQSNINPAHNKKIITEILEKEANNEKIMKFLNMNFNDWIYIFTRKKKIEHDIEFDGLRLALKEIINDNKEEDDYLTRFVFYLYNYKKWFQNKKGTRKRKAMKMI